MPRNDRRGPLASSAHVATVLAGLGGLALVGCVLLPIAREGVGSATPLRGLSDLILAGSLRAQVPSWLGILGYLPAICGVVVLLAELLHHPARAVVRGAAVTVAALTIGALLWLVSWRSLGDLGRGLQLGVAGVALSFGAWTADVLGQRRLRRPPAPLPPPQPPNGTHDVLSAMRH